MMRKLATVGFFAFVALAMSAVAQKPDPIDLSKVNVSEAKSNASLLKSHAVNPAEINTIRMKAPAKAPYIDTKGIIKEPEGMKLSYLRSYLQDYGFGTAMYAGDEVELYYDEPSKTIYIKNLVDAFSDGNYMMATLTEGDLENGVISIPNNQVMTPEFTAMIAYLDNEGYIYGDIDAEALEMTIKDGVIHGEECYFLIMDEEGFAYAVEGEYTFTPFDNAVEGPSVPANGVKSEYRVLSKNRDMETRLENRFAKVWREGNDFYFDGLLDDSGIGYVVKGELSENGKIAIQCPQYVGKLYSNIYDKNTHHYFNTISVFYDDVQGYVFTIDAPHTLYVDFDENTKSIDFGDNNVAFLAGNMVLNAFQLEPVMSALEIDEQSVAVPAGLETHLYAMKGIYNAVGSGYGHLMRIGRDGNDFYFIGAYSDSPSSAFKVTLDPETNSMMIPSGTPIGVEKGYLYKMYPLAEKIEEVVDEDWGYSYYIITYDRDNDVKEIEFDFDEQTGEIQCYETIGFESIDNIFESAVYPSFYPVEEISTDFPSFGSKANGYYYNSEAGILSAKKMNLSIEGERVYLEMPGEYVTAKIEGRIAGDKIIVNVPQLVCVSDDNTAYFLRVGKLEDYHNNYEAYWSEWIDGNLSEVEFDYDSANGTIRVPAGVAVVSLDYDYVAYDLSEAIMSEYKLMPATPADPFNLEFEDKENDYWGYGTRYCISAEMPNYDTDGNYIDYDNLTFSLYIDDELFVFTPEEFYGDIREATTQVPFTIPASGNIPTPYWSENARSIYFQKDPVEKVGMQTTYHCGDDARSSNIVYHYLGGGSNVEEIIENKEIVSEIWYDISGRKVVNPAKGFSIKVTTFSDGSKKVVKSAK